MMMEIVRMKYILKVGVVLSMMLISACSSFIAQQQEPRSANTLWRHDQNVALDVGEHHPAIQSLFAQAQEALSAGKPDAALTYLDQARQIQPNNARVLYRQAWLASVLGKRSAARQLIEKAKRHAQAPMLMVYLNELSGTLN